MRRVVPLLGVVVALALSGTAAADTFTVVRPHPSRTIGFSSAPMAFTVTQSGPMSFSALRTIWQAAGNTYGIPWEVLAAINKVETNFGSNLGPSSAGAIGWMQFMPATWARWGIDANGDGVSDPNNPTDAIFSAAHYLAGCGGQFNIAGAIYCYNHATWYVNDVLSLAALYGRGGTTGLVSFGQLQSQLDTARSRIKASKLQLGPALEQARKLSGAERTALHALAKAHLLSDQLEAQKRVTLIGVRRHAAEALVSRLRDRLHAANTQLTRVQGEANGVASAAGRQLLSAPAGAGLEGLLPSGTYGGVVSIAMQYLGVPYVWGGASPSGFDCSGLVKYVFAQVGISLPHYTVSQWNYPGAVPVARNQLQPGDLIFFNGLDHEGIYVGNGYFIHAPHTGDVVRIDYLGERWFAANYDGARRIVGAALGNVAPSDGTTTFTTSGDSNAFTSNVVYFTH
jgi:cell wall-associated NlpC family hydrolase